MKARYWIGFSVTLALPLLTGFGSCGGGEPQSVPTDTVLPVDLSLCGAYEQSNLLDPLLRVELRPGQCLFVPNCPAAAENTFSSTYWRPPVENENVPDEAGIGAAIELQPLYKPSLQTDQLKLTTRPDPGGVARWVLCAGEDVTETNVLSGHFSFVSKNENVQPTERRLGELGAYCPSPSQCDSPMNCQDRVVENGDVWSICTEPGIDSTQTEAQFPAQEVFVWYEVTITSGPSDYSACGDGKIDRSNGETCDDGTDNVPQSVGMCPYGEGSCRLCDTYSCTPFGGTPQFCGDGILQAEQGEACDGTPGCSTACKQESTGGAPRIMGFTPGPDVVSMMGGVPPYVTPEVQVGVAISTDPPATSVKYVCTGPEPTCAPGEASSPVPKTDWVILLPELPTAPGGATHTIEFTAFDGDEPGVAKEWSVGVNEESPNMLLTCRKTTEADKVHVTFDWSINPANPPLDAATGQELTELDQFDLRAYGYEYRADSGYTSDPRVTGTGAAVPMALDFDRDPGMSHIQVILTTSWYHAEPSISQSSMRIAFDGGPYDVCVEE